MWRSSSMRDIRFTFLCTGHERKLLMLLSQKLARTQSDTVRWLIREAGLKLIEPPSTNDLPTPSTKPDHSQAQNG